MIEKIIIWTIVFVSMFWASTTILKCAAEETLMVDRNHPKPIRALFKKKG